MKFLFHCRLMKTDEYGVSSGAVNGLCSPGKEQSSISLHPVNYPDDLLRNLISVTVLFAPLPAGYSLFRRKECKHGKS
jgi:hypothetical protein